MRFTAAYDTLVHQLKNGRRIWGQKYDLNVGQVWDWWIAGQLSMIRLIFRSSARNFWSSLRTHSSKISLFIQLFFCDFYSQGRCLTFLKQQGFLDFQTTNTGSFSPVPLATAIPVSLALVFFPPKHFSPLRWYVLSGRHWWKRPKSSALKISSNLLFERIVGKVVSLQDLVISFVTDLDSPTMIFNKALCLKNVRKSRCKAALNNRTFVVRMSILK